MVTVAGSVVPLYHQIYLVLREKFVDANDGSEPLPGEIDLARRYQVSRITMRKALDLLVREGLITRRRGAGTFVNARVPSAQAGQPPAPGLLENIIDSALGTSVRVISMERVTAARDIAAELELAPQERVMRVVRVRSREGMPVSHITTYVPEALGACLDPQALGVKAMLTLLEEHGVKAEHARQTISARLADSEVARLLDTPVGAALLAVKRLVRDADGRPIQLLHGLYRPDRYEYRMDLQRTGSGQARVWYPNDSGSSGDSDDSDHSTAKPDS